MLASQQVLHRMQQLLVAAATSSGARVYTDRLHPVSEYPSTLLSIADEDLQADEDDDITWPRMRLHELLVDVQVHCQAAAQIDDHMADQALQVLRALEGTLAAATLQPLQGCTLQSNRITYQPASEGQASNGTATVRFTVLFRTLSNDPETFQ
jgi:hypothetical protein